MTRLMRTKMALPALAGLIMASLAAPAFALQATDTMAAWKDASAADRAALLERLLGKSDGTGNIVKCLDETARIPGHADLELGQAVKFCAASREGQPV